MICLSAWLQCGSEPVLRRQDGARRALGLMTDLPFAPTGFCPRSLIMPDKPKKLSDTARALLTSAAMRDDHLIPLPRLPVAATRQVIRSLLNGGLAEEVPAPIDDAGYAWRTGEDGDVLMLRATRLGLARVAADEGPSPESVSVGTVVEAAAQRLATIGTNAEGAVAAVTAT